MDDGFATRYNEILLDHFRNPRNVGEIADADGKATIGDPSCGDSMTVWIKVGDDHSITDVKYKVKGCPAAIAVGSIMTELAMGKNLDDAAEITDEVIEDALGGLPAQKKHCSNLAAATLYKAIMDYVLQA